LCPGALRRRHRQGLAAGGHRAGIIAPDVALDGRGDQAARTGRLPGNALQQGQGVLVATLADQHLAGTLAAERVIGEVRQRRQRAIVLALGDAEPGQLPGRHRVLVLAGDLGQQRVGFFVPAGPGQRQRAFHAVWIRGHRDVRLGQFARL